jgi:hypothetical protein
MEQEHGHIASFTLIEPGFCRHAVQMGLKGIDGKEESIVSHRSSALTAAG